MSLKRDNKSEWVIALNKLMATEIDEVPKDWKTRDQIAKDMGLSPNQASKIITRLKRAKMIEVQKFKIKTQAKTGIIKQIDHYRLLTSSAKESRPRVSASSKS